MSGWGFVIALIITGWWVVAGGLVVLYYLVAWNTPLPSRWFLARFERELERPGPAEAAAIRGELKALVRDARAGWPDKPRRGSILRWATVSFGVIGAFLIVGGLTYGWLSRPVFDKAEDTGPLGPHLKWTPMGLPSTNNATAEMETRWRDGFLHYRVHVTPEPRLKGGASLGTLFFRINDADRFQIIEVHRTRSELTALVDDRGKTIGLLMEGKVALSREEHRRVAGWMIGLREQ